MLRNHTETPATQAILFQKRWMSHLLSSSMIQVTKTRQREDILSQKLTGNVIFKLPASGRLGPLLSKLTSAEAAA